MRNKRILIYTLNVIAICLGVGNGHVFAQPSPAQIKKDISGPKTVSVTFNSPGKIEWDSAYKKYIWSRYFTATVKTDEPGVLLKVIGFAAYDVMGGRYVYWRTFTSSNSFSGIPNPTPADVQALIKRFGVKEFVGDYIYRFQLVGSVESIGLAPDPKFEWHTPNSVSLNVVGVYTKKGNGNTAPNEHGQQTFRVRLYRDNTKAEWNGVYSTRKEWKVF